MAGKKKEDKRFKLVKIQQQELDWYKDMAKVAYAAIEMTEANINNLPTRAMMLQRAWKAVRHCVRQSQ